MQIRVRYDVLVLEQRGRDAEVHRLRLDEVLQLNFLPVSVVVELPLNVTMVLLFGVLDFLQVTTDVEFDLGSLADSLLDRLVLALVVSKPLLVLALGLRVDGVGWLDHPGRGDWRLNG